MSGSTWWYPLVRTRTALPAALVRSTLRSTGTTLGVLTYAGYLGEPVVDALAGPRIHGCDSEQPRGEASRRPARRPIRLTNVRTSATERTSRQLRPAIRPALDHRSSGILDCHARWHTSPYGRKDAVDGRPEVSKPWCSPSRRCSHTILFGLVTQRKLRSRIGTQRGLGSQSRATAWLNEQERRGAYDSSAAETTVGLHKNEAIATGSQLRNRSVPHPGRRRGPDDEQRPLVQPRPRHGELDYLSPRE